MSWPKNSSAQPHMWKTKSIVSAIIDTTIFKNIVENGFIKGQTTKMHKLTLKACQAHLHTIFNVKKIIDMGNSFQRKLGSSMGQHVESQQKLQRSQHHPCFKMAAEVDPKTKSYTKALPRCLHSNNLKKMWVLMYITKSWGTMFCHGSRPTMQTATMCRPRTMFLTRSSAKLYGQCELLVLLELNPLEKTVWSILEQAKKKKKRLLVPRLPSRSRLKCPRILWLKVVQLWCGWGPSCWSCLWK